MVLGIAAAARTRWAILADAAPSQRVPERKLDPAMMEVHGNAADGKTSIIYKGIDVMSAAASSTRGKAVRRI